MENTNQPPLQPELGLQQELPNATAVLVLGILSIVTCSCYGIPGLILGIIALVMSNKPRALYNANPGLYRPGSYKNLNAGRICAIIGLTLSALSIIFMILNWDSIVHEINLKTNSRDSGF